MIIIKNNIIPFKGYKAINIFGVIFTKETLDDKSKNHEKIHTQQIIEMGVFGFIVMFIYALFFGFSFWWTLLGASAFYVWYCIEYLFVRFFHKKQYNAYYDISLEEEAHKNDENLQYIEYRKEFAWMKYLKPMSNSKK